MQACNKCCVLKNVCNLFCEPIFLPLLRIMSCEQLSKVLVSPTLFGSLLLTIALFLESGFITGSIFHCHCRSSWLILAHSDSLWPSLALHDSLWLALALSLSFSGAHRLTMSLLGSLSHCPLIWCQAEGREFVKCYHFTSFCDSVPTSNSTGRWSGLANRGEIGERANKQYHLLQYLSEHILVLLITNPPITNNSQTIYCSQSWYLSRPVVAEFLDALASLDFKLSVGQ